jgi:hypothetical protein
MNSICEMKALAPWAETLPPGWEASRIDAVADVLLSNVDKHTIEGEQPVRLCNYVDVSYNERITAAHDFMEASAEPREIQKFQIRKGDLLVTKDSEAADDIAIPEIDAVASFSTPKDMTKLANGVLNQQMKTLRAYRSSLIYECVTGQRRVAEADVRRAQNESTVE